MPLGREGWVGPPPKEICIVMLSAIGDAEAMRARLDELKLAARRFQDLRLLRLCMRFHPEGTIVLPTGQGFI